MTGKEYAEIIDSFDVENNSKYLPHNGHTYCNIFAQDVAKECGTPCLPVVALPCGISLHTISSPSGTL